MDAVDGVLQIVVTANDKPRLEELLSKIADRLGLPRPSMAKPVLRTCGYCSAKEGEPCVTKTGNRTRPHAARSRVPDGFAYVEDYTDCGFFAPYGHQAILFGAEVR
jgi:hypothetical protein